MLLSLFFLCSLQVPLHLVVKYFLEGYPNYSNIVVWLSIIVGQPLAILCYFHDYYVSSVQVCVRNVTFARLLAKNDAGSRVEHDQKGLYASGTTQGHPTRI